VLAGPFSARRLGYCVVTVTVADGRLRERSLAVYVSVAGGFVVDVTTNAAQPPLVVFGVRSGPVVA
jgi:hypothetical protein